MWIAAGSWLIPAIYTKLFCLSDDYQLINPLLIACIYSFWQTCFLPIEYLSLKCSKVDFTLSEKLTIISKTVGTYRFLTLSILTASVYQLQAWGYNLSFAVTGDIMCCRDSLARISATCLVTTFLADG